MMIDEYVTVLHSVTRDCSLGVREQYVRMIIQALLLGIESDRVRRLLFEFSLEEAVVTGRAMKAARRDLKTVQDSQ